MNIPRTCRAVLATALRISAILSWLASRDATLDAHRHAGAIGERHPALIACFGLAAAQLPATASSAGRPSR